MWCWYLKYLYTWIQQIFQQNSGQNSWRVVTKVIKDKSWGEVTLMEQDTIQPHLHERGAIVRAVYHVREQRFISTWCKHPIGFNHDKSTRYQNLVVIIWLGLQPSQLGLAQLGKFQLKIISLTFCWYHDFQWWTIYTADYFQCKTLKSNSYTVSSVYQVMS